MAIDVEYIQVSDELEKLGYAGRAEFGDVLELAAKADRKKIAEEDRTEGIAFASCGMRGWRESMEDASLMLPYGYIGGAWRDAALFGVFDGHGGEQVARYVARRLPLVLSALPAEKDAERVLTAAYQRLDESLRLPATASELRELTAEGNVPRDSAESCGTTAVCCMLRDSELIVANCGDSRAVLCRAGQAVALTEDHKPNLPGEEARIVAAGGYVEEMPLSSGGKEFRVNGNLNLSRALGDLQFKDPRKPPSEQIISGVPETRTLQLKQGEDEFVLIGCDGLWECMSAQQMVNFVRSRLPPQGTRKGLTPVLGELLDACCANHPKQRGGLGCDNITAVLVRFEDPAAVAAAAEAAPEVAENAAGAEQQLSDAQRRRQEAALSEAIQKLADRKRRKETPEEKAQREAREKEENDELEASVRREWEELQRRQKRRAERELEESKASKRQRARLACFDEGDDESEEVEF
eukprot:TRINITY_DN15926_c0_g1_i1.p1 TRINITY_DN15926_c0_g1~~TRINITY_DN15926_c0_g1_i1.p1  ORF type:complete len:467 (-),score=131.70 TRINITY_DN15926_c0_g1_i1:145-1545(-)